MKSVFNPFLYLCSSFLTLVLLLKYSIHRFEIFYLRNVYKLYDRLPILQSVLTERIVISAGKIS